MDSKPDGSQDLMKWKCGCVHVRASAHSSTAPVARPSACARLAACVCLAAAAAAQFARSPRHAELERRRPAGFLERRALSGRMVSTPSPSTSPRCVSSCNPCSVCAALSAPSCCLCGICCHVCDEGVIDRTILTRFDNVNRASSLHSFAEWLHHRSLLASCRHACMVMSPSAACHF